MKKTKTQKLILSLILALLLSGCGGPTVTDNTNSNKLDNNSNNSVDSKTINSHNVSEDENMHYDINWDNPEVPVNADSSTVSDSSDSASAAESVANSTSSDNTGDTTVSDSTANVTSSDNTGDATVSDSTANVTSSDNTDEVAVSDGAENITPSDISNDFFYTEITDSILSRISGKSYPADSTDCKVNLSDLRYCHVLYYGFDNLDHEGELIVNKAIADDILEIFKGLYEKKYEIEKMILIDEYGANDELSMRDNNSSAFNYRVISGSSTLSNHSYGLAIDINPLYNPYVVPKSDGSTEVQPATAVDYVDRYQSNRHFIRKYDACYNLFIDHGFTWGGDWNTKKDYQHFEYSLSNTGK